MNTLVYRLQENFPAQQTARSPCDVCLGVLQSHKGRVHKDELVVVCTHWRTVAELKEAALRGCGFCLVYWNMLTPAEKDSMLAKDVEELPEYKLEASISSFGDGSLALAAPKSEPGTNRSFVYRINRRQPMTSSYDERYAQFVLRPLRSTTPLLHAHQRFQKAKI